MKILALIDEERVRKHYHPETLPGDFELCVYKGENDPKRIAAFCPDADAIFCDAVAPVGRELIEALPKLKLIESEGAGYHLIDLEAAAEHKIYVCNALNVNSRSVAEQTVLLMLAVLRRLCEGDDEVRAGRQIQAKTGFINDGLVELGDCRVGFIGFGAIAKETAKRLVPFGCSMCTYSIPAPTEEELKEFGVESVDYDTLLRTCDIVSIHVPVTKSTTNMLNAECFAKMKPGAIVINVSRGEVFDQEALAEYVKAGKLRAGIDTLAPEPVTLDNPLVSVGYGVTLSPHVAGVTTGVFVRSHGWFWENCVAVSEGRVPKNLVPGSYKG